MSSLSSDCFLFLFLFDHFIICKWSPGEWRPATLTPPTQLGWISPNVDGWTQSTTSTTTTDHAHQQRLHVGQDSFKVVPLYKPHWVSCISSASLHRWRSWSTSPVVSLSVYVCVLGAIKYLQQCRCGAFSKESIPKAIKRKQGETEKKIKIIII